MPQSSSMELERRAEVHGALSDPMRLAAVDLLLASDRSPQELQRRLGVTSNLLAHHLDVLEAAGLILRHTSSGDRRRRYVRLQTDPLGELLPHRGVPRQPALFICSANTARSQIAAALWMAIVGEPAASAGTHPAAQVHPRAAAAARRAGLDLSAAVPRSLDDVDAAGLTITVCDVAHEELGDQDTWLHWSIDDPVPTGSDRAFDRVVDELRTRIRLATALP